MNSIYSEQILADKLSKLNSTQQCIETLSHWCIFHRSKAESVVTTWDKQFHKSEMAQKVPLLYLANDILQNSKRKGNEFVTEFWKVLPTALKDIYEKGDDHGKNVVSRLVAIWGERRVFGSRCQSLKDVMLGEELPPPLEFSKKRSRSVRIVKRDSRSIRTKLTIGGAAEKIVSAFHLVISEHPSEDEEMSKCKSAVHRIRKMEKDVDLALTKVKDPKRRTLEKELEEEEEILKQSIQKLKVVEANRLALVSQLRDALHEQESELENVLTQMQVAQAQAEEASNMRKKLKDENYVSDIKPSPVTPPPIDANSKPPQTPKKTAAAIAAEVADRLAASTSSQYIMSSVLSTFAAEEAKNAGLTTASTTVSSNPINTSTNNNSYFVPQSTMQNQIPNSQAQYQTLSNPQYLQQPPQGGVVVSYGYGTIPQMPPPVPPPTYMVNPMVSFSPQTMQMGHQQSAPNMQQPMPPPSFRPLVPMQPPGMMYYTLPHQSQ